MGSACTVEYVDIRRRLLATSSNGALHNYNKRGKLPNVWQVQQQLQRAVAAASGKRQMQLVVFSVSAIFLLNFSFEQLLAGSVARARTAKNADSLQQCSHTVGHTKGSWGWR